MKKVILLVVVMLCIIAKADAQFRYGVKVGIDFDNYSHMKGDHKNHNGWQFGPMVQVIIPAIGIGIQPEALFSLKSVDLPSSVVSSVFSTHSLWYLQVPVNIRYELNLMLFRPFVTAGPYFRWVIDRSGEHKNEINDFDWGVGFGGGVEILKFQLGIRYSIAMKDKDILYDVNPNSFTISLGRLF